MSEEASRTPSSNGGTVTATATIGSSLIPIINRLQDILAPFGGELSKISLPQVAVVGSQSSGKSSVLEALIGRDFLPRGCDICTRRPLALMLENRPRKKADDDGREWAEFRHLPGRRFYDFATVREEIMAETNKEAGANKGVSDKQIRLKISSPKVLNMTLIDLPGITKVPVGDQPTDIEARIRRMIMAHIKQENCIILAVTPANSDLATSDALQMAKEADPTGTRTIGVITKLDIMDRGTNACNFLLGKVVPLCLGYVGVVNRCQEDINQNRSIQDALAYEAQFFRDQPVYNGLSDRCGIPQLAKKLNQILEQQIRIVLPGLKSELNSRMIAVAKELKKYGHVMESKAEQEVILLNILTRYCDAFSAMVDGTSQEMSTKELSGGARIYYIFQSIFVKTLEEVDPCQDLTDDDIRTAIQNATGTRSALFVPEVPFELLVRRQIARFLDPCLQCLRFVHDELIKISRACEVTALQRFPVLRRHLDDVMGQFLHDGVRPAEIMIENLIEIEVMILCLSQFTKLDYINSSHPCFIGGNNAVELALQEMRSLQDGTDAERVPTTDMGQKSRTVLKAVVNGVLPNQGNRSQSNNQKTVSNGRLPSLIVSECISYPLFMIKLHKYVAVCTCDMAIQHLGRIDDISNKVGFGFEAAINLITFSFSLGMSYRVLGVNSSSRSWGISSIFGSKEQNSGESPASKILKETPHNMEQLPSVIQLKEPPSILRSLETTEREAVEIIVTKLMLQSYHDIVRKNIQDLVPKAIMHYLVNHTKRNLHNTFIRKLYRENHIEELLEEQEDVDTNRKRALEVLSVLQQAVQTLDEVESDVSAKNSNSISGLNTAESSRISPSSPFPQSRTNGESMSLYELSSPKPKSRRLLYPEEQLHPLNSNGRM
ncbi:hypothetical protein JRO89_XS03G0242900 [Xanthoceras sorbifolium]|uniref:Dynamin-related protein 3A-like n=1 Tax=Xanthoceras sorbifolium TaxID=99658 RepID=A0ABQ8IBP6_9ROSI|nr:hypothetical protein JRO89_XS03G0242900 [Xanthoceras sorbifolium]